MVDVRVEVGRDLGVVREVGIAGGHREVGELHPRARRVDVQRAVDRRHAVAVAEHPVAADAVRRLEAVELESAPVQHLGGRDARRSRRRSRRRSAAASCGDVRKPTAPRCQDAGMDPEAAEVKASGGVVWRRDGDGSRQVVVVHRPRYDDWSLPKGKLDPGESWEEAALREVEEEVGLRCRARRGAAAGGLPRPQGPREGRPLLAHGAGGGRGASNRTTRWTRCAGWTSRRRPRC